MTIRSPLYLLERSDAGVVHLDRELKVVAMNSFARRVLPIEEKAPFEKMVLSFHPERSVAKVKFLLDQAECPVSNPPPMTMIINIPERVLLIKVTKLSDVRGESAGYTLIFYDITELVSGDEAILPSATGAPAVRAVAVLGAERVMFGTDYPIFDSSVSAAALANARISAEERAMVAARTAMCVLGIPRG